MTQSEQPFAASELSPTIGEIKRALEWWSSSEEFRQAIAVDPAETQRRFGLTCDLELIRPLWDPFYARDAEREKRPLHPSVLAYRAFFNAKTRWRDAIKEECSPDDPRFKAWRDRQVARNMMENGAFDDYIIHTPLAIEITDGCSVGCWFCGVGATRMAESWPHTPENAALWRDVVAVLYARIGAAAKWGFCYWATDPLDNPDYELFADAFADEVGMYPQTTTAQGHKNPERVRKLLKHSEARGCRVNRFSVLTESLLRKIYAAYTPDELTNVEIVSQMPGATTPKAAAGAFRELAKIKGEVIEREQRKLGRLADTTRRLAGVEEGALGDLPLAQPGTIACVSGFLLNMVKRSLKLISPCRASDRWPLGYIVYEECTFTDAADLDCKIGAIMDAHMPLSIAPEDRIRINPDFSIRPLEDGFGIASSMTAVELRRPELGAYVRSVGHRVDSGQRTAGEIALAALFEHGVPEANTLRTLEQLFVKGLLVDAKGRVAGELEPAL